MSFFSNTWFVGIIGGIISGIIVFLITSFIVNKVNKKDYYKTVNEINLKVSKLLIMSISEGKMPSPPIVDSLLSSLAKRNKVQKKDINSIEDTYNDLITELFETNFIPIDKKQTLAESLIEIKNTTITKDIGIELVNKETTEKIDSDLVYQRQKTKLITLISTFFIIITLYPLLISVMFKDNFFLDMFFNSENNSMILIIMTVTFSLVIAMLTSLSLNKRKYDTKKRREEFYSKFKKID